MAADGRAASEANIPALTDTKLRKTTCPPGKSHLDLADSSARGLRFRIYASGRRAWLYRYADATDRKRMREVELGTYGDTGMSYAAARAEWERLRDRKSRGEDPRAILDAEKAARKAEGRERDEAAKRERYTFSRLVSVYLEAVSTDGAESFKKSWAEDARILRRYFLPTLDVKPASAIERSDIEPVLTRLRADGKRTQANRCLACVRAMFRWAGRRADVPVGHDPTAGLTVTRERPKDRVLRDAELSALLSVLTDSEPHRALRMILLTAQRPGEVVAMRSEDVREDVWRIEDSKNSEAQEVYLSAPARALVARRKGAIFPAKGAGGCVRVDGLSKVTKELAVGGGLAPFTPHDLRRTAATWMGEQLAPDRVIRRILNHREQGVTAVYQRARVQTHARDWWKRWAEHVEAL